LQHVAEGEVAPLLAFPGHLQRKHQLAVARKDGARPSCAHRGEAPIGVIRREMRPRTPDDTGASRASSQQAMPNQAMQADALERRARLMAKR
jgi:hypothetical protein